MDLPVWHGTAREAEELLAALGANCTCASAQEAGAAKCAGHDALTHNQRFLDGLLWARRVVAQLRREEWSRT